MKRRKIVAALLVLALILVALAGCGKGDVSTKADAADMEATSMHLRKTEGTVAIKDKDDNVVEAREQLGLYNGYNVATDTVSFAWVDLDSVKLTKMDEESQVSIEKDGKNLKIQLESGNLFFHVTEPLGDDERMSIRTSTMAIGIRGTCGWVETMSDASKVYLLEGKVEVKSLAGKETSYVNAGEYAIVDEDGVIVVDQFNEDVIPAFVLNETDNNSGLKALIEGMSKESEEAVAGNGNEEDDVVAVDTVDGEYKEYDEYFATKQVFEGSGKAIDDSQKEWVEGPFAIDGSVGIYSRYGEKIGYTKSDITVDGVNKLKGGKWLWVSFTNAGFFVKAEDMGKFVAKNDNQIATAKTGNTAQNNKDTNNSNSGNASSGGSQAPAQTQPTAPAETVVPTPAPVEPTPAPAPTTQFSEAEVIAIYESALRAAGMVKPEDVLPAELIDEPTIGMGWHISDIPMNDVQGFAAREVTALQNWGYNMYYIENQGSSDGYVHLKVYRGTIE